jgi:hypothetical protein
MGHPRGPTPDLDPYFVPEGHGSKGGTKWAPRGEAEIRSDLLPTEAALRVAGTIGMVLSASTFVIFAVPVSGMLREAGGPDGILLVEDWLWRRWVARMASLLTLAVVAAVNCWGLSRLRPWARWPLVALAAVPPLALVAGLGLRAWSADPALRELGDVMTMPCVGLVVYPASIAACWAACSRRGRTVLSPHYEGMVARTPKLSARLTTGLPAGLALALAMLILYWTLLLTFLGALVACGVIRSI